MPVQESSRRVVVSHNVDKALKEGNHLTLFIILYMHINVHIHEELVNCEEILIC